MQENFPVLFIEIDNNKLSFKVGKKDKDELFELLYSENFPVIGIENNKITHIKNLNEAVKKALYSVEQKLKFTFKEAVLILNDLNFSFLNVSGFKNLNGSQLVKENITYIINSIKSKIDNLEKDKKIIHIFNSKYLLDKKTVENLPIGLFGDFYSHELSFVLINKNDYKNLINLLSDCNLRIKRVISKSFIDGVNLMDKTHKLDSFIKVEINESSSKTILFENSALTFSQEFDFGSQLITNDIAKVILLKKENIKSFISKSCLHPGDLGNDTLEKEYFENTDYRKIKKKLIYEIADARIQEIAEIVLFKNINFKKILEKGISVYLKIEDQSSRKCFKNSYVSCFSKQNQTFDFAPEVSLNDLMNSTFRIVQFGWNKEAVPIIRSKRSIIRRFLDLIFS